MICYYSVKRITDIAMADFKALQPNRGQARAADRINHRIGGRARMATTIVDFLNCRFLKSTLFVYPLALMRTFGVL